VIFSYIALGFGAISLSGLFIYVALEIRAASASYRAERRASYWHRRRMRNQKMRQNR
jgi:hypothetical protein